MPDLPKGRIFVIFIIPFFLSTVKHAFYMPDGKDREKSLIHCDLAAIRPAVTDAPVFALYRVFSKEYQKALEKNLVFLYFSPLHAGINVID